MGQKTVNERTTNDGSTLHTSLVLLCLLFFGISVFPQFTSWTVVLFGLTMIGLYLRIADVFLLGLMCGLAVSLWKIETITSLVFAPLPVAIALVVALAVGRLAGFRRETSTWIKKGDLGPPQIAIISIIAAISAIALVSWRMIVHPDISDLTEKIPHVHPVVIVALGLVFSITNATCEEFFWRGMIFDALERTFLSDGAVVSIQALSFGVSHILGFPRGASGIFLASIYGYMLGLLKLHAKGLLAPIIAHVFADMVIYAILVSVVWGK